MLKIVIIDTYYPNFLTSFWSTNSHIVSSPYQVQIKTLCNARFGTSDYYSHNLNKLGHSAIDIVANDLVSQKTWAKENGIKIRGNNFISKMKFLPYIRRYFGGSQWMQDVVLAQIEHYSPDVVYVQDLSILSPRTLKIIKDKAMLVGQIACPLPPQANLRSFDLILTSFPHYVKLFENMGISSEYFRIGFEERLLSEIGAKKRVYDVSFVGSFSPHHKDGTALLERIAKETPIHVWGSGLQHLPPSSPLRDHYHGEAWGREMYEILAKSKIVINRHIGVADNYANNMRLFESTGMGAMLITDHKKNLKRLFDVGKELESYKTSKELLAKINYYLSHDYQRRKISGAGQKRTLLEHSYQLRMQELVQILKCYL